MTRINLKPIYSIHSHNTVGFSHCRDVWFLPGFVLSHEAAILLCPIFATARCTVSWRLILLEHAECLWMHQRSVSVDSIPCQESCCSCSISSNKNHTSISYCIPVVSKMCSLWLNAFSSMIYMFYIQTFLYMRKKSICLWRLLVHHGM